MLHGVLTQLVTGVLLVGLAEGVDSLDRSVDRTKIGVKLVVTLVITRCCAGRIAAVSTSERALFPDRPAGCRERRRCRLLALTPPRASDEAAVCSDS